MAGAGAERRKKRWKKFAIFFTAAAAAFVFYSGMVYGAWCARQLGINYKAIKKV